MPLGKYRPDEKLTSIHEIDYGRLQSHGIRGLIFDLDNTIGVWGFTQMEEAMLSHLKSLEARGFQLAFLSNDEGHGREHIMSSLYQYPLIFSARKPELSGYRQILQKFQLQPSEMAMIGDQLFTDIFGAKRLGMYAIMVDPVAPEVEDFEVRIRRFFERVFFLFWRP